MREKECGVLEALIGKGAHATKTALCMKVDSDAVRALQVLLEDLGFGPPKGFGKPGIYEQQTRRAVRKFARRHSNFASGERVTLKLARLILENHRQLRPKKKKTAPARSRRSRAPTR